MQSGKSLTRTFERLSLFNFYFFADNSLERGRGLIRLTEVSLLRTHRSSKIKINRVSHTEELEGDSSGRVRLPMFVLVIECPPIGETRSRYAHDTYE